MDEAEGGAGGGFGGGGNPGDSFHRNEAISAVADDGFLGEEDDDYEDLYNDVNVGEGFLQSLRKNEENKVAAEPQAPPQLRMSASAGGASGSSIPGVGGGVEGTRKYEGDSRVSGGRSDGYLNQGFGGNDVPMRGQEPPGAGIGTGSGAGAGAGAGSAGGTYGGGGGLRVEFGQPPTKVVDVEVQTTNASNMPVQGMGQHPSHGTNVGNTGNDSMGRQLGGGGNMNGTGGNMVGGSVAGAQVVAMGAGAGGSGGGGGGTILFVGDLHWWTTDAELESELVKYGPVKEVKFFDEKASGKSKGYCQVEFYDSSAASLCKEGMNGHPFNGRPCVVAFASPFTVKKMGEAQVSRQTGQQTNNQPRRAPNDVPGNKPSGNNIATGGNYQGAEYNRGYGRGGWGRGNAQMGNRNPGGPMRNRPGGMGGRGIMANAGNGFGQGMGGTPPMMHPQQPMMNQMGQGFDPAFAGPMGRMGNFGGFPGGPGAPFQGMMPSFPPVASVGLPGVAPHVNPAFFGRGMPMNGMGMMPNVGVDGPNMGMWSDPNMGVWAGDEHAGRAAESSYGEDAVSELQYGEGSHDRVARPGAIKEKERGADRRQRDDWEPGYDRDATREKEMALDQEWPDRRHREDRNVTRERGRERDKERSRSRSRDRDRERGKDRDRERERDRERYRDDRERYADHHRYRGREPEYEDEWDRGRSSRTHSKSRMDEDRPRSREADYGKRRQITSG